MQAFFLSGIFFPGNDSPRKRFIRGITGQADEWEKEENVMRFRPCIDIHNGKVKQIVGSSLRDAGNAARDNFVSEQSAADFARFYRKDGLAGGHVILLNKKDSPYYAETKRQAYLALAAYPGGLMAGGGIALIGITLVPLLSGLFG